MNDLIKAVQWITACAVLTIASTASASTGCISPIPQSARGDIREAGSLIDAFVEAKKYGVEKVACFTPAFIDQKFRRYSWVTRSNSNESWTHHTIIKSAGYGVGSGFKELLEFFVRQGADMNSDSVNRALTWVKNHDDATIRGRHAAIVAIIRPPVPPPKPPFCTASGVAVGDECVTTKTAPPVDDVEDGEGEPDTPPRCTDAGVATGDDCLTAKSSPAMPKCADADTGETCIVLDYSAGSVKDKGERSAFFDGSHSNPFAPIVKRGAGLTTTLTFDCAEDVCGMAKLTRFMEGYADQLDWIKTMKDATAPMYFCSGHRGDRPDQVATGIDSGNWSKTMPTVEFDYAHPFGCVFYSDKPFTYRVEITRVK